MQFSTFTASVLFLASSFTAALPAGPANGLASVAQPFFITTSTQKAAAPVKQLANANATSLFDPYYQPIYQLRLIGPGYNSLPKFRFSSNVLHTNTTTPHGFSTAIYNSTHVNSGALLGFADAKVTNGNLQIVGGYLLGVGTDVGGWTLCPGDFGETVIGYKKTGAGCTSTFLHLTANPPY